MIHINIRFFAWYWHSDTELSQFDNDDRPDFATAPWLSFRSRALLAILATLPLTVWPWRWLPAVARIMLHTLLPFADGLARSWNGYIRLHCALGVLQHLSLHFTFGCDSIICYCTCGCDAHIDYLDKSAGTACIDYLERELSSALARMALSVTALRRWPLIDE